MARRRQRMTWARTARPWRGCLCETHDWQWVTHNLATGAMPDTQQAVDRLVAAGITHVVNTATEEAWTANRLLAADQRITYLWNPTPDDGRWKEAAWFQRTIDFARAAMAEGGNVLVHCHCGSNRGPSSAYAVMIATGWVPGTAERMIRSVRPRARLFYLEDARAAVLA